MSSDFGFSTIQISVRHLRRHTRNLTSERKRTRKRASERERTRKRASAHAQRRAPEQPQPSECVRRA